MRWSACLVVMALAPLFACGSERASAEQCRAILERLVMLELEEMGFDDPALAQRRQTELVSRYRQELTACVGRRLRPGAMACVASASSAEVVSHDCLR